MIRPYHASPVVHLGKRRVDLPQSRCLLVNGRHVSVHQVPAHRDAHTAASAHIADLTAMVTACKKVIRLQQDALLQIDDSASNVMDTVAKVSWRSRCIMEAHNAACGVTP